MNIQNIENPKRMHGLGFSSMFMPKLYFRCPLYGGTGKVYTVDLSKQGYKIFCRLGKGKKYFVVLPRVQKGHILHMAFVRPRLKKMA